MLLATVLRVLLSRLRPALELLRKTYPGNIYDVRTRKETSMFVMMYERPCVMADWRNIGSIVKHSHCRLFPHPCGFSKFKKVWNIESSLVRAWKCVALILYWMYVWTSIDHWLAGRHRCELVNVDEWLRNSYRCERLNVDEWPRSSHRCELVNVDKRPRSSYRCELVNVDEWPRSSHRCTRLNEEKQARE